MRAVVAVEPGGPEVLNLVDRPDPVPDADELLIAVHATALNRADTLQRKGGYDPPEGVTDVLGLEAAGEVVALGDQVSGWSVGDRVCAVLPGGGYAELATVPAAVAIPIPAGLDYQHAAAIPEVFTTAYDNLFNRGRLAGGVAAGEGRGRGQAGGVAAGEGRGRGQAGGERALLHGGSSGVGTAGIQLARRAGCDVAVTASSPEKLDACAGLGAELTIPYRDVDFADAVLSWTDGAGVDVILDIIGGPYLERNLSALAVEGRLVIIGLMGGAKTEINLARLLTRRLTVTASTLRARSVAEKAVLAAQMREHVMPGFADGSLRPVIDRVLPLAEVAQAHRLMESSDHIGKIVLRVR